MDFDTLQRLASKTTFTIDPGQMSSRTRNAVVKAIESGYLNTYGGTASAYFRVFTERFKLPYLQMSERSQYGRTIGFNRVPVSDKLVSALSEWWTADRVSARLEDSEEWNRISHAAAAGSSHYRNYVTEPNWTQLLHSRSPHVSIMSKKNRDAVLELARIFVDTPQYQQAARAALASIAANDELEFVYRSA